MKQIVKTLISIVLIVVFSVLPISASGESFNDGFDDLKEADWELWGNHSMWQVKDGFLRTTIQAPDFSIGLLQFKGIPGNYENFEFFADDRVIQRQEKKPGYESFTIIVKSLGAERANFGIAIGRRFPDLPGDTPYFYFFTPIEYTQKLTNGEQRIRPGTEIRFIPTYYGEHGIWNPWKFVLIGDIFSGLWMIKNVLILKTPNFRLLRSSGL